MSDAPIFIQSDDTIPPHAEFRPIEPSPEVCLDLSNPHNIQLDQIKVDRFRPPLNQRVKLMDQLCVFKVNPSSLNAFLN